jgi:hypothetical protein
VSELPERYVPAIPILAEPRTFMALVPAKSALAVAQAIKAKYEREMGKVRNRLPLTLGVVYAGRRTPLAAVLDAGRRMLSRRPMADSRWQVAAGVELQDIAPDDGWPKRVLVSLRRDDRQIHVKVSTVMGDGDTRDVWYPYWQVAGKPADRNRWFVGPDGGHWVHVCDLRPGDTVTFTPSTFDFEYLDTSARRFEVAYGTDGLRLGEDRPQRPYLLEQVDDIQAVWQLIKPKKQAAQEPSLSTTQIKALETLIQAKRSEWLKHPDEQCPNARETFRQFCRDALATAGWNGKKWKDLSSDDRNLLEEAAVRGMLADALELHLTIAKEEEE